MLNLGQQTGRLVTLEEMTVPAQSQTVQAIEEVTLSPPCFISVFLPCSWGAAPYGSLLSTLAALLNHLQRFETSQCPGHIPEQLSQDL